MIKIYEWLALSETEEEMIPHWGLAETQLEMRKHMRSETQGNGIRAYLSFCCLVYASLMGHSSFIYWKKKADTSNSSPSLPLNVLKSPWQRSQRYIGLGAYFCCTEKTGFFIFLKWALYLKGALFWIPTGLKLTDITIYFYSVWFFHIPFRKGFEMLLFFMLDSEQQQAFLSVTS